MRDRESVKRLKEFDEETYRDIDLDSLMMFVMGQLEKLGADLSYENAVVAAFILFPKKFSLPGYPEYPDSNRVHQCLWHCTYKTKRWLGGKTRQGFFITERSRAIIKKAENALSGLHTRKAKATSQTRRKESLMAEVLSSPAYTKYAQGKVDSISEADFCHVLQCTLDSERDILAANLAYLERYADELRREDVVRFLGELRRKFKIFLTDNR